MVTNKLLIEEMFKKSLKKICLTKFHACIRHNQEKKKTCRFYVAVLCLCESKQIILYNLNVSLIRQTIFFPLK